jgi:hypothetical protein
MKRQKLATEFLRLSKSAVIAHAGLDRSTLSIDRFTVPSLSDPFFEPRQIKSSIALVAVMLPVAVYTLMSNEFAHRMLRLELSDLAAAFRSYADSDIDLLWMSFSNLLRFFGADATQPALRSDSRVDALYRSQTAGPVLRLFHPNLRLMIGAAITNDTADDDPAAAQEALQTLLFQSALSCAALRPRKSL